MVKETRHSSVIFAVIVWTIFGGVLVSSVIVWIIFGGTDGGGYDYRSADTVEEAGVLPSTDAPDYDYRSLIDDLRSAGATVEEHSGPTVEQSPDKRASILSKVALLGWGRRVSVNGETIQVYEYPDVLAADTEAGFVSPNGYNISVPLGDGRYGGPHYEWVGAPHFYKKDRVIVLYVEEGGGFFIGDDPPLVEVLQRALGPPFAGSSFITR